MNSLIFIIIFCITLFLVGMVLIQDADEGINRKRGL